MTVPPPESLLERDVLRLAADWTFELDADLIVTAISSSAGLIGGTAYPLLVGEPLGSIGRLLGDGIEQAVRAGTAFEGQLLDAGGSPPEVYRLAGTPRLDEGRVVGVRGFARRLDAAEVERSAMPDRLGAELRGPLLDIIQTASEMLDDGRGPPLSPRYVGYARDISAAGRHLLSLVDEMLGGGTRDRRTFDLREVVSETLALIDLRARAKQLAVTAPADGPAIPVDADRRHILQILVNLLTNAVKFTPEGGAIAVELAATDGGAAVAVRDSGPGIAPDDQERVFERSARLPGTANEEGSGLGLHIARQLARQAGGDIRLESAPGAGACFTLLLPNA